MILLRFSVNGGLRRDRFSGIVERGLFDRIATTSPPPIVQDLEEYTYVKKGGLLEFFAPGRASPGPFYGVQSPISR